ncbi:hypothetical protein AA106555_1321 [Neokomagataea thailandica NBRC 106555]|uniref:Glycosyltransferase family 2 protein n=2 Tax=Neokomagataea TaxID=1223423 RepID=A0A4Y6VA95_9PROT|nr:MULTISPECIES: glycosyltransferase family 2 protein [Neokomagataea]QDH25387.1 glycosyltransferase family 2 protein [Neokomagataea tanensis]GBR53503.1 hypothetical protein AA106555_1321 [Neokomagataea thailandica NBRC 106555]
MQKATCAVLTYNAEHVLTEWVAWHILQGFHRILIIDAGSSDQTLPVAYSLTNQVAVEIFEYRPKKKARTYQTRSKLIKLALDNTPPDEWLIILDQDEFFSGIDFIPALTEQDNSFGIKWKVFGKNHNKNQATPYTSQITHCAAEAFPDHLGGRFFISPSDRHLAEIPFWDSTSQNHITQVTKAHQARVLHYPWLCDPTMPQPLADYYDVKDNEDFQDEEYSQKLSAMIAQITSPAPLPADSEVEDDFVEFETFTIRRLRPSEEELNLLKD